MEATDDNENSIIDKEVGEDAVRELINEIDTTEADIDDGNRIFISPIAKRIAEDKGIEPNRYSWNRAKRQNTQERC